MGGAALPVTDDTWEQEVESSKGYVLVDFWAEWCGPCKMIAPTLDELAEEMGGKLKIVKLDVDNNSGTAGKFSIRSIPCLVLFKDGEESDRVVGAQNKAQLKSWLDEKMSD
jgi:thioredoxin 1